jgi:hypothetical protein
VGRRFTANGHRETFEDDENILYLDYGMDIRLYIFVKTHGII